MIFVLRKKKCVPIIDRGDLDLLGLD